MNRLLLLGNNALLAFPTIYKGIHKREELRNADRGKIHRDFNLNVTLNFIYSGSMYGHVEDEHERNLY